MTDQTETGQDRLIDARRAKHSEVLANGGYPASLRPVGARRRAP
jgi:hypothetical protein